MVAAIIMNNNNAGRFFWNISGDVGPGCANAPDDVELVRFGYHCMGISPFNTKSPAANKAAFAALPLQGGFDQQLQQIIRMHQAERGGVQDGKVSSIKNASGNYGGKTWIMVPLNNNMMDIMGENWPRIDRHHKTSPLLTQKIKSVFTLPPAG